MTDILLPSELEALARAKTVETITLANQHFKAAMSVPTVQFNLRGHTAGYASMRTWSIRINHELLLTHPDEQIQVTVPHEVAHLVAYNIYGRGIPPHGYHWKFIMDDIFGVDSQRCHKMPTTAARKVTRYKVYCGCPSHIVTAVILKRIQRGAHYTCRKCRQRLSLQPLVKPSFTSLLDSIK